MAAAAPRVLVVEDNEDDALLVQRALDRTTRPFARERVVLLDLALPDAQRFDAVQRIGADHPFVPVVVLTGLEDEDVGLKAVQGGAQDYIVKGNLDPRLLDRSLR